MNEVLDKNFRQLFPKIEEALRSASFVSIDAEFSGISDERVPDLTLFDSMQERYGKQRRNVDNYAAVQIGLTIFRRATRENRYTAESFTFYLLPKSIPTQNRKLVWDVSSLEFLRRYNFDIKKWMYEGISYLNEDEERSLRERLRTKDYAQDLVTILEEEDKMFQSMKKVAEWLKKGEKFMEIDCGDFLEVCCLQRHLRNTYRTIWTERRDLTIVVVKVDRELRASLEENDNVEVELLEYCLGFSRLFKLLCELKKPIVGHNLLLDLMFMYKQFYMNLPDSYEKFKADVHRLFPVVFDTKFLSFEMKKIVGKETWKSNVLGELYQYFKNGSGGCLVGNSPKIQFADNSTVDKETYHDAGWDSYYTGYCFIKMAHVYAVKQRGGIAELRDLTHAEIMASLKDHVNRVNLIRADLSYLRLDGPDPPSSRPQWLNISAISQKSINVDEISAALSSFESLSIKPYSSKSVLVATPNYRTARDILQHFQNRKDYQAATFNPLKHSPVVRSILWGTLVLSGSMLVLLIHQTMRKPSVV